MDFTSIEFYTIAFCVAMVLVGFFLKQKRINPASSTINSLELEKLDDELEVNKQELENIKNQL